MGAIYLGQGFASLHDEVRQKYSLGRNYPHLTDKRRLWWKLGAATALLRKSCLV